MARTGRSLALLSLLATGSLLSCSDSSGPPALSSIVITPSTVSLTFVGETRTLTATVTDEGGGHPEVTLTWTSSNLAAVSVSATGEVTALGNGSATITAAAGGVTSAPVPVSVAQAVSVIEVDRASLSFSALGDTEDLTATAADQGGSPVPDVAVNWITTNESVVSITAAGRVTAEGNGTASVRASAGGVNSANVPVTVQQVATSAELTSAAEVTLRSLGETSQISVEARDARDRAIDVPNVTYASSDTDVATVSETGQILARGNGSARIDVAVDDVPTDPVEVTVEQEVVGVQAGPDLILLDGPGEMGEATATAVDALGVPVEGVVINWASDDPGVAIVESLGPVVTVTSQAEGTATLTASAVGFDSNPVEVFVGSGGVGDLVSGERVNGLTGPAGLQRFYRIVVPPGSGELHVGTGGGTNFAGTGPGDLDLFVRFGELPTNDFEDEGQFNSGRASNDENIEIPDPQPGEWFILVDAFVPETGTGPGYAGASLVAAYQAGPADFDISLAFISTFTPAQQQVIRQAADRWEAILPQDLFSLWMNIPATPSPVCGVPDLVLNSYVDDLLILVALFDDEPGGTLAQAGPCQIRVSGGQDNLPLVGLMAIDLQDLDDLEASGQLEETALHEMGHVMGIGPLWDLTSPPLLVGAGGDDPYFSGPLAVEAFDGVGGANYSGMKVPVENTGGSGTRDSHWRESIFDDELMTGFAEAEPGERLSTVTIQSLLDIGWPQVDAGQADDYQLPGSGGAAVSEEQALKGRPRGDDALFGALFAVDPDGNVTLVRSGTPPPVLIRR